MRHLAAFALGLLLCAGCATQDQRADRTEALLAEGFWEDAIAELETAVRENQPNHKQRTALVNARAQAVTHLLREADAYRQAGRPGDARSAYERILRIQPAEMRASAGLQQLDMDRRHAALIEEAEQAIKKGSHAAADASLRRVVAEAPRNAKAISLLRRLEELRPRLAAPTLSASLKQPISLEFRDANLRMVLEVISKASGVNFVLDKDIRADTRASIFVKNSTIEDAIESLLSSNQLAKKVLNENSILVYPNTAAKIKEYQDLVIRNFFLSSVDAKQMMNLLRTILKTRDVYLDEKRNLLVIRDTPEAVILAERLIQAHDQAEPEVVLEVEVLEVSRTKSSSLGVEFTNRIGFGVVDPITLRALRDLNSTGINVTGLNPALTINLRRVFGDTNLLANPRIRVRNREKAKIHVGERVPIISSIISGTTAITSQSVNYLDVGLKLEVDAQVLDDDVVMKVNLEVNSLGELVQLQNASAYRVGTRNASTTLTLKDGETQVLAGLITDNDRESAQKLPGLGDLPVVGRLFSNRTNELEKTEIVLSITPHIVRRMERPDASLAEFWSGPETNVRSALSSSPQPPPQSVPGPRTPPGGVVPLKPPAGALIPAPAPGQPAVSAAPLAPGAPAPATGAVAPAAPTAVPGTPFIFEPPPGVGSR